MVTFGSHVGNHQFQPFLSGVYAGVFFSDSLSSRVWLTGCSDFPNSMQVSDAKWAASKPSSAETEADHSIAEGPRKANLMSNRSYDWGWCHWCKKCHAKREVSCHGGLDPPWNAGPTSTYGPNKNKKDSKTVSLGTQCFGPVLAPDLTSTNHPRKLKLWSQKQRRRPRKTTRKTCKSRRQFNSIRVFATPQVVVL